MSKNKPEPKFRKGEQVRILDGKYIDDYIGSWVPEMKDDLYRVVTINDYEYDESRGRYVYLADEVIWSLDEKGLEPCSFTTDIDIDYSDEVPCEEKCDSFDELKEENKQLKAKIKELEEEVEHLLNIEMEWNNYAERRLQKGR